MARSRTARPTRSTNVIGLVRDTKGNIWFDEDGRSHFAYDGAGNPIMEELVTEVGRRAGLHTKKSAIRERQARINRTDRRTARAALRQGHTPEPRQPRGRALWSAA